MPRDFVSAVGSLAGKTVGANTSDVGAVVSGTLVIIGAPGSAGAPWDIFLVLFDLDMSQLYFSSKKTPMNYLQHVSLNIHQASRSHCCFCHVFLLIKPYPAKESNPPPLEGEMDRGNKTIYKQRRRCF